MRLVYLLPGLLWLLPAWGQRVITTVAGTDWLFSGDGRPARNAPLGGASGLAVAVDRSGNYYICDTDNLMVFKVTPDGIIHNFAGNGFGGFSSGNEGLAINAALFLPVSVATDSAGNVYIGEFYGTVRKVTPDGVIHAFAGTGDTGFAGDGGLATQAVMTTPSGLATDSAGNLYITDTGNNRIRKVTTDGIITTIAGTGEPGSVGQDIPALKAQLFGPLKIAVDPQGNVYFTETIDVNVVSLVRKIDTRGIITTAAGGTLDVSDGIPATKALVFPLAVSTDAAGNLYIADSTFGFIGADIFGFSAIRKVDASTGLIQTVAGKVTPHPGLSGDGGKALAAVFHFAYSPGLAVDPAGNIYVADDGNYRIRRVTPDGNVDSLAGNGLFRFSGDGGPATSATLYHPFGVIGDSQGNLFIAETQAARIRKVAPDGTISVYAGNNGGGYSGDGGPAVNASLYEPVYMTFAPDGSLVFSDVVNCVVRSISVTGIISTIAGNNVCDDTGDGGPALQASLNGPFGVAYDSSGELIITEPFHHRIRAVLTSGKIFTIAGDGNPGFSGDNGSSLKAEVNQPSAVRVYNGGIYFADSFNNRIRKIDLNNNLAITTVAGNGTKAYKGDGGQANSASLSHPQSLAFDTAGNMYIADTGNSVVRKVDLSGVISTYAGVNPFDQLNDGGFATNAAIHAPVDLFIDGGGTFFIADLDSNRVRALLTLRPAFQVSTDNLAFTAQAGSTALDQRLDVTGGIPGIPFSVASSATWLTSSLTAGNMPSGLTITANPAGLTAGSYQGTLTINASSTATVAQFVRVAFTVTAAGQPSLSVKPASLSFYTVINSPAGTRGITVSNLGGGSIPFTARVTTTFGSWLTLSTSNGTLNAFASRTILATLNPAGLAAGTYSGTVTVSSAGLSQSVTLPVTMTVTQVEQTLLIPQSGLTFYAIAGGGKPPPQFFSILNTGRGQLNFTTRFSTLSGNNWLSVFPGAGSSTAESNQVPQERVDVDPAGLQAGTYYGTVQVVAPTAVNNPQFVSVILNVLPAGSHLGPIVEPTGLIFTTQVGVTPGSQTITVQSVNATALTFHSGVTTVDGTAWLTTLPPDGLVTQAQAARIVVQPQTMNLAAGVYRGSLTLSFSDGSIRVVAVVVVVIPNPIGLRAPRSVGGCSPKTLVPVFTQISSGFTAAAGFPGQVAVQVVDDCGTAMTTGDVITSFSNGDTPVRLTSLKDGNWVGTWTPQRVVSPITVTAEAAIPDQNLKGEVVLTGSLQANDATPILGAGQVVNGASFLTTLSPGSFVTLFGSKLAQTTQLAPSVPLPTSLAGSTVLVAGNQIPIYYASDGQVNAILPYGLAVNTIQQVLVSRGSSLSVPQGITVAAAAPGIFATTGGQGIVEGFDGTNYKLADASNPVKAGQTIVIYCTGLGEVTPSITAGNPTPLSPLSTTVNKVTLTIGGVEAAVAFAGLTPGQTGLYQVNAVIPPGVTPGSQVPVVLTAAGQQSAAVTIAVR